jgi:quercetin dioxygenase-like cupin family protein
MRKARIIPAIIAINLVFLGHAAILAADGDIVPEAEKAIARKLGVSGPTETHGVESSEILGSIELGHDFKALEGRSLRARKVALAPGGVVGVHQHTNRPGVLYMLEGELAEFRNDRDGALTRRKGDTSFEKDGVIHWWRNDSSKIAIALVVDIVPNDQT